LLTPVTNKKFTWTTKEEASVKITSIKKEKTSALITAVFNGDELCSKFLYR
jgi:hypothetical protein